MTVHSKSNVPAFPTSLPGTVGPVCSQHSNHKLSQLPAIYKHPCYVSSVSDFKHWIQVYMKMPGFGSHSILETNNILFSTEKFKFALSHQVPT